LVLQVCECSLKLFINFGITKDPDTFNDNNDNNINNNVFLFLLMLQFNYICSLIVIIFFFVLTQQCQHVYYTCPPNNKSSEWWAVIKTTARSRYNVHTSEFTEDDNNMRSFDIAQSDEISQPCRVLPTQTLDDPNIFVEASYYTKINHCELL